MSDVERDTAEFYGKPNLGESILGALRRMGKDVQALRPEDLAPVDAYHLRGLAATEELARFCQLKPEQHVLDVGCGLGGTARHLALHFGCRTTGLDLTAEYIQAAQMLTGKLRLDAQVAFKHGSALEMPFEDAAFDVVWSEYAQMNIPDKPRLYGEIHRVLRKGGRFAFHDVLAGPGGEPYFPAPWASDPSYSALIGPAEFRRLLTSLGFDVKLWEDKTAAGRDWLRERLSALREKGPPPLGFHLLIGPVIKEALPNQLRNLEERRITLVQGVVEKMR
jgi:SAM-dependent methyltransferase